MEANSPESAPARPPGLFRFRFTMAEAMLLVIPAASASALFVKIRRYAVNPSMPSLQLDAPILFIAAIVLTAVALGSLKSHSSRQMMLQVTLACLGYFGLILLAESQRQRPLLYWFEGSFALLVTAPLLVRRYVKLHFERGPRRRSWKNWCEAIFFSFLTMMLVLAGVLLELTAVFFQQVIVSLKP